MAQWEQVVVDQELKLQEREEQDDRGLECEQAALASHESNISSREATQAAEWKNLEETRARVLAHELTADNRDMRLNSREEEMANKEKWLAEREMQPVERQPQELATTRNRLEELRAAQAGETQKVWYFLGWIEVALVPFGFSPLCTRDAVEEVSAVLLLLDSIGAKILKLEEVISSQLEAEDRALAVAVAEYVLTCFRSRDP
jgi:hypothetical protein